MLGFRSKFFAAFSDLLICVKRALFIQKIFGFEKCKIY